VRIAYLIPPTRSPQPLGVETLRYAVVSWQNWYREQMLQHGFGPQTFLFETEDDGVTPKVHLVDVSESESYLREDIWGHVLEAASNAGITVWASGEVWLLVPEIHIQSSDGAIEGGVALGGSWGSGTDGGVAMIGSHGLAVMRPSFLQDNRPYSGQIIQELGPYPLQSSVSFAWFEGTTLSELHSTYLGAALHELSHGFGLPHDMRNDSNFRGNLMGNGLRGIRGCFLPGIYPEHFTRLSRGNALALHTSRYFNPEPAEQTKPRLLIRGIEAVIGAGNRLEIRFSCSDSGGLGSIQMMYKGDLVESMLLEGTAHQGVISTPFYEPDVDGDYSIRLYDASGNRADRDLTMQVPSPASRPPRPALKANPQVAVLGSTIRFDPRDTTDSDDSLSNLRFQYDFDNDGAYDTGEVTSSPRTFRPQKPGCYLVGMRVTDRRGGEAFAMPVPVLIHAPVLRYSLQTMPPSLQWEGRLGYEYRRQYAGEWNDWQEISPPITKGSEPMETWILDDSGPWQNSQSGFFRIITSLAD
jgi:hypothetical protein